MAADESKTLCQRLQEAVVSGNEEEAALVAKSFITKGYDPLQGLHQGLIRGMDQVTDRWVNGDYFLPDVIMSANAMQAGSEILHAEMIRTSTKTQHQATVVLGTILGDIHNIGKNLIRAILTAAQYRIVDIGENQPPQQFINTAKAENAEIIAVSCILTTSLPYVEEVIQLLEKENLRPQIKIIVGGVAITPQFVEKINADGYRAFGVEVPALVDELLGFKR
ncbi:MAG: cobalamin B12-binding domain-containing protein [Candidatus Ranarchaeia archaeon]